MKQQYIKQILPIMARLSGKNFPELQSAISRLEVSELSQFLNFHRDIEGKITELEKKVRMRRFP